MTTPEIEYNPDVPENPSDSISDSQPEFLNNFAVLYQIFLVNHIPLDSISDIGAHTIIQLLEQKNSPQTDLGEISFFSKNVKDQTEQLFLKYDSGQEFALTTYQIYSLGQSTTQNSYFSFLPGNILIYFGDFTSLKDDILYLYPPIAKNIMSVSFSPIGSASLNNYKPNITLQTPENGFVKAINVKPSGSTIIPPCYYMVLANI